MTEKIGAIKNPLTIIGIFAGIAEISGTIVLPFVTPENQLLFIYFLIIFPSALVIIFFATLNFNNKALYAPSDFSNEENYIKIFKYDESKRENVQIEITQEEMLKMINLKISEFEKINRNHLLKLENSIVRLKEKDQTEDVDYSLLNEEFEEELISISNFEDANKLVRIYSKKGYSAQIYQETEDKNSISHQESIWLGFEIPIDKAKDILLTAKEFYPHLKYISLSNFSAGAPDYTHHQIYIGGSSETAREEGLKPLRVNDWNSINEMTTLEELHKLINSKYN